MLLIVNLILNEYLFSKIKRINHIHGIIYYHSHAYIMYVFIIFMN